MITREDLLRSSEYWIERIQNKIFNDLTEYIEKNKVSNKQIAEILGLSKGRVSQILSGENLNFRLEKSSLFFYIWTVKNLRNTNENVF